MTKITKCEYMNKDWVYFVINHSVADIVTYFQSLPANAEFEADAGYEQIDSDVFFMREETDEEYDKRIKQEATWYKSIEDNVAESKKADRKNVEDAIAQLQEQLRNMP